MSAEAAFAVRSWPVGTRTCTATIQRPSAGVVVNMSVEWSPAVPSNLTREEWKQYRTGRDRALASVGEELGVNVAVLEL